MPLPNLERLVAAGVLHAEAPAADAFAGLVADLLVACAQVAKRVQVLHTPAP